MELVDLDITLRFSSCRIDITLSNHFLENCQAKEPHKHIHSKHEFHFIEGDDCLFLIEETPVPVKAGEILLIAPGAEHCLLRKPDQQGSISVFSFAIRGTPTSIALPLANCGSYHVFPDHFHSLSRLQGIQQEIRQQQPFYYEKICAEFSSLLTDIARCGNPLPSVPPPVRTLAKNQAEVIEGYFSSQYASPHCSKKELAALLYVSERQLCRILHSIYHKTFREMLLQARMEHAQAMLTYSSCPSLESLARQTGYSSASAFSAAYRKYFGHSPGSTQ